MEVHQTSQEVRRNLSFLDKKDLSSHISSWSKEWLFKICKVISRHLPWPWTMYPILLSSSFRALQGLGPAYLSELSSSCSGAVYSPLCGSESTKCASEPPSSVLRFPIHTLHLLFPQPQMPFSSWWSCPSFMSLVQLSILGSAHVSPPERTSLLTTLSSHPYQGEQFLL